VHAGAHTGSLAAHLPPHLLPLPAFERGAGQARERVRPELPEQALVLRILGAVDLGDSGVQPVKPLRLTRGAVFVYRVSDWLLVRCA
jgi:hypothetical protein